eukprot:scaffold266_cov248-Pinguiococcus_pyrenoidosus.AAC.11
MHAMASDFSVFEVGHRRHDIRAIVQDACAGVAPEIQNLQRSQVQQRIQLVEVGEEVVLQAQCSQGHELLDARHVRDVVVAQKQDSDFEQHALGDAIRINLIDVQAHQVQSFAPPSLRDACGAQRLRKRDLLHVVPLGNLLLRPQLHRVGHGRQNRARLSDGLAAPPPPTWSGLQGLHALAQHDNARAVGAVSTPQGPPRTLALRPGRVPLAPDALFLVRICQRGPAAGVVDGGLRNIVSRGQSRGRGHIFGISGPEKLLCVASRPIRLEGRIFGAHLRRIVNSAKPAPAASGAMVRAEDPKCQSFDGWRQRSILRRRDEAKLARSSDAGVAAFQRKSTWQRAGKKQRLRNRVSSSGNFSLPSCVSPCTSIDHI